MKFLSAIGAGAIALLAAALIKGEEKKPSGTQSAFPSVPLPFPGGGGGQGGGGGGGGGVIPANFPIPPVFSPAPVPGMPQVPRPGDCLLDASAPSEISSMVNVLLKSSTSSRDLNSAADMCERAGLPMAAGCLRARARELDSGGGVGPTTVSFPAPTSNDLGIPYVHVIRFGDTPSGLARFFTGNADRWRELGPVNPHLGSPVTETSPVTGVLTTNYPGWQVGVAITIPDSWAPWAKGTPPLGARGGGSAVRSRAVRA